MPSFARTAFFVIPACMAATLTIAQPWPGGGPGPYAPYAAGKYAVGNPYAKELNELAIKDPAKHENCFKQANEKQLRREARWKFMLACMRK